MRFLSVFILLTSLKTTQLFAFEKGDWLIRGRAIYVKPNDDTTSTTGAVIGSTVSVHSAVMPELDFTYMATKNIGIELILATTEHTLNARGTLEGTKVGSVWLLPPTLIAQYHFFPEENYQPYLGVGINYTLTYNEKTPLAGSKLRINNSVGFAMQAGVDIMINDHWFANLDMKYVTVDVKAVLSGAVSGSAKVDIDPLILGVGIGRRF